MGRTLVNRAAFNWQISYQDFLDTISRGESMSDVEVVDGVLGLLFGAESHHLATSESSDSCSTTSRVKCLSSISSQSFFKRWIQYGEKIMVLHKFLYEDSDSLMDELSFTLTAYVHSLRGLSHTFITGKLVTGGDSFLKMTPDKHLHDFLTFLFDPVNENVFHSIDLLSQMHYEILQTEDFAFMFKSTSVLINTFYKYLDIDRELVWNLFLDSLRPTLQYIEQLLDKGKADDPKEEFPFDICEQDLKTSTDFWESCIKVRDDFAIPEIFMPVLDPLLLGIKSRLLLTACGIQPSCDSKPISLWKEFMMAFSSLQIVKPERKENVCETKETTEATSTDSGEGDELEDDFYSCEDDQTTQDVHPDILDEEFRHPPQNIPKGHLTENIDLLPFPNITPMDSTYIQRNFDCHVEVANPDFNFLPNPSEEVATFVLPDDLKFPFKLAIEKALHTVIRDRCAHSSHQLLATFKELYLRQLQFRTDYWLLHKKSHCLSLYLDSLFSQVTSLDGKKLLKISFDTHHFDDELDVRANIIYSTDEIKTPLNILQRLNLYYEELDPFSHLLLNSKALQDMFDGFHFLLQLKYSKWLLDSVKLRRFLKSADSMAAKHELFCLRFKCLRAIVGLLEYIMFELDIAIQEVLSNSREANDFNQLVESLSTFCTSIRHITLQDKKVLIELVTSTSLSIYSMCKMDDLLASDIRSFTTIRSNIRKIENIVSLFVYRMSQ